jgi:hypothetical protein
MRMDIRYVMLVVCNRLSRKETPTNLPERSILQTSRCTSTRNDEEVNYKETKTCSACAERSVAELCTTVTSSFLKFARGVPYS